MKGKGDYDRSSLAEAIHAVGLRPGDTVLLQASIGRLGVPRDVPLDFARMANMVTYAFQEVLAEGGTLLMPTYSYSIGRGEPFDVDRTPSAVGELTEVFRKRPDVVRSIDPMMSTAGTGPKAETILRDILTESYGKQSVFDNLTQHDGYICTLGLGLWWATYTHYIERMANVPFRFDKKFTGSVHERGRIYNVTWTYFAAPRISNCDSNSPALEAKAVEHGIVRTASVGRAELHCVRARDLLACGLVELKKNPWLTAKGPPAPPEVIFASEPQWSPA